MRTRRWLTWVVFTVCALAMLEGLGWVTWQALRSEQRELKARSDAAMQETVRLALWRMESEVTPIIAQEAARPYFHYLSFYPAERAYTRMWQQVEKGEVLVPSPLLEPSGQCIRLHFQISPDGQVSSPQAPSGNMLDLAESQQYVDPEFIVLADAMLSELRAMLSAPAERFAAQAPGPAQQPDAQTATYGATEEQQIQDKSGDALKKEFAARQQAYQNVNAPQEASRKARPEKLASGAGKEQQFEDESRAKEAPLPAPTAAPASDLEKDRGIRLKSYQAAGQAAVEVEQGPLEPRWLRNPANDHEELIVQRTVRVPSGQIVQGFWMDWPALRTRILAAAGDLLPSANLVPVDSATSPTPSALRLASIPAVLIPGDSPALAGAALTPTHATLVVTWLAAIGAILAIAVVLRTAMELSDRRGRFVSAVTHELRTPLTTFCLYTEMLAEGMVKEEQTRRDYLSTLKGESRRLAGIVENVLDFARLGGERRSNGQIAISVADLLAQARPALERCAAQSGMELQTDAGDAGGVALMVDPRTVERILLNLVENSCKYASEAPDRRLHLRARRGRHRGRAAVEIRFDDHGPGVPRAERSRIFEPFHRARRDAQGPKSGLGLGLALARGLARGLGGNLECLRPEAAGASFRLVIPATDT